MLVQEGKEITPLLICVYDNKIALKKSLSLTGILHILTLWVSF